VVAGVAPWASAGCPLDGVLGVVWAAAEPARSARAAAAESIRSVVMVEFLFREARLEERQALTVSGPRDRELPRFTSS
jgi:hypothetical protein